MTDSASETAIAYACALLIYYGFDLNRSTADELIERWLCRVPVSWVRLAVVEALYQGRYKAISIEIILGFWQRRGKPVCHFTHDFERIICSRLPEPLMLQTTLLQAQILLRVEQAVIEPAPLSELAPPEPLKSPGKSAYQPLPKKVYQADWSRSEVSKPPIRCFIPDTDSSDFYEKLKAVAQTSQDPQRTRNPHQSGERPEIGGEKGSHS